MTEIMPFPENNYETVLLDRPFSELFYFTQILQLHDNGFDVILLW